MIATFIIGAKEAEARTVSPRWRLEGDLGAMPLEAFIAQVQREDAEKSR